MTIVSIVGARPQFVKCAIVSKSIRKHFKEILVHTGQHYDFKMSDSFFEELDIPDPDYNLNIGGLSHAKMTAQIMLKLEEVVEKEKPNAVLTYGDTDSTLAAGLVAAKMYIPLVHIEAGERIYQMERVPEEINRVIVDHVSNYNLCSTEDAVEKLKKEGLFNGVWVGDPMYDLYLHNKSRIERRKLEVTQKFDLPGRFALLTIHRVENTFEESRLSNILKGIVRSKIPVVWPIHPRTKKLLESSSRLRSILSEGHFNLLDPLPYIDFSAILASSAIVITDSGGVIRESYFAGKFSIVPMLNSWWKNIVGANWSIEVSDDEKKIEESILKFVDYHSEFKPMFFGDGNSADRICQELEKYFVRI